MFEIFKNKSGTFWTAVGSSAAVVSAVAAVVALNFNGSGSTSTPRPAQTTQLPVISSSTGPSAPFTDSSQLASPSFQDLPAGRIISVGYNNLAVDLVLGNTSDGTKVVGWGENDELNGQKWSRVGTGSYTMVEHERLFIIRNFMKDSEVMTTTSDTGQQNPGVYISSFAGTKYQYWWFESDGSGNFTIHNDGYIGCLTAHPVSNNNAYQLTIENCTSGNSTQSWELPTVWGQG